MSAAGWRRSSPPREAANARRTDDFHEGLHDEDYVKRFLAADLDAVAERIRAGEWVGGHGGAGGPDEPDRLGSTTHIAVIDADGNCASVTCSNGTGSGVVVPGTGVHLNNMLGEEDLNPQGFHRIPPGRRVSSMMSPTLALRDGEVVLGLGSAGSNRIRSAILQTVVRVLEQGMDAGDAVVSGRLHFEAGTVQAEPGVDRGGPRRPRTARRAGGPLEAPEPLFRRRASRRPGSGRRRVQRRRRPAPRRCGGLRLGVGTKKP